MKTKLKSKARFFWALSSVIGTTGICKADEVSDWNQVMLQASLVAPAPPAPAAIRLAAIVQAAVFDAVNGIERRYTSIYVPPAAPQGTSERAAAVQAAYATLVRIFPDQKDKFDQQRTTSLAAISDSTDSIQQGISWGQSVADQIWAWRSQDGFSNTVPPYMGGTDPGQWRPTPPANAPAAVPQLATATPWVIRSPSQFRPPGPPALTSDPYTADFNETKNMGGAASSARTADQTLFARFWQAAAAPDYFDQVAISLAAQRNFSMVHTARLLALANIGMADALIGCWDAKYTYSAWRPITAIQLADTDGNDATTADASWSSLIAAPGHPEYPSAHSCVTGAATRILSQAFGEETSFKVVSNAMSGVTRNFSSFTAALEEVKNARIVAGIHFRTSCVDGSALGLAVADYIAGHVMLPMRGQ